MNNMTTNQSDFTIRSRKKSILTHLIPTLIFIVLALVSFFAISKWASSIDTYRRVIATLNELQKKALALTGTATALATGAAAIPGDATTPIANKLADVAGYMVIVYAVIIIEKYLLTITGYITFKILLPIGCVLLATGNFLKVGWKEFIYRIGIKSLILGLLLWGLVPTSVWVTNKVNETYSKSYDVDYLLEDIDKSADENKNISNQSKDDKKEEAKSKEKHFSFSEFFDDVKDKIDDAAETAGTIATEKITAFENGLNKILEGVAVIIVTTCVIPILVMLSFVWILKSITGLNIPTITKQSIPRVSKMRHHSVDSGIYDE